MENFRDLLRHPVPAPAGIANAPLGLLEERPRTGGICRAQSLSLVIHIGAMAIFVVLLHNVATHPPRIPPEIERIFYPGHIPRENPAAKPSAGQGSGGHFDLLPATKGSLAFRSPNPIIPPRPPASENPTLPVIPTVPDPTASPQNLKPLNLGLPWMKDANNSQGPGGPEGYGSKPGNTMGESGIDGPGGRGRSLTAYAPGTSYPECVYCPSPSFTDEARRTKLQGTVMIELVVTADGRASNIRITKGLGLGLDERAVEAVRNWRFKPARDPSGRAVPAWIPVEVSFHLY